MDIKLQALSNDGKETLNISEEQDRSHITLSFSDNPKQEYSVHLDQLYRALKALKNIKKIKNDKT